MITKIHLYKLENIILLFFILLIIVEHLSAMYETYSIVENIKTDDPSGSTLAERYLIIGDWPANRDNNIEDFTHDFKINKTERDMDENQ
ncbi:hypothetical protein CXF83_13350 [Shewanella sp. Choline-02u-19]|uniref:hypothetical protein n=1 Tax=Shewanella sp. Choline-02u-19 TaxID=2058309 RepID=UPI000C3457EC|nr:hypothetical protein [Shewanella sp. Choline-02u-19]PKI27619.1 hypothetical protein CXF83_13350 [Shewanella sp. Choline-02u-19]